jgi:hypothetical protein
MDVCTDSSVDEMKRVMADFARRFISRRADTAES